MVFVFSVSISIIEKVEYSVSVHSTLCNTLDLKTTNAVGKSESILLSRKQFLIVFSILIHIELVVYVSW